MASRLSIATFNLYNLQQANGLVYEERVSGDTYRRKVGWIGRQLRGLDADLVGFQEVWSLDALRAAAAPAGFAPGQVHVRERDGLPAVGLACRLPTRDLEWIEAFPAGMTLSSEDAAVAIREFSRPVLRAWVTLPNGTDAVVYVAHLKSKRPILLDDEDGRDPRVKAVGYARSLLQRSAEAAALRWLVVDDTEGTRTPVVVVGDLNDGVAAVTTRIIAGDPPFGGSKDTKRAAWDVLLYSAYELQARRSYRDVFYTHVHDHHFETLDHILVSEELAGLAPDGIGRMTELTVWNDHLNASSHRTNSDHAQMVARFRLD